MSYSIHHRKTERCPKAVETLKRSLKLNSFLWSSYESLCDLGKVFIDHQLWYSAISVLRCKCINSCYGSRWEHRPGPSLPGSKSQSDQQSLSVSLSCISTGVKTKHTKYSIPTATHAPTTTTSVCSAQHCTLAYCRTEHATGRRSSPMVTVTCISSSVIQLQLMLWMCTTQWRCLRVIGLAHRPSR